MKRKTLLLLLAGLTLAALLATCGGSQTAAPAPDAQETEEAVKERKRCLNVRRENAA